MIASRPCAGPPASVARGASAGSARATSLHCAVARRLSSPSHSTTSSRTGPSPESCTIRLPSNLSVAASSAAAAASSAMMRASAGGYGWHARIARDVSSSRTNAPRTAARSNTNRDSASDDGDPADIAPRAGRPEFRVLEHLAHRIDAEDAVPVRDQRSDLRRLVGIVFLLLRVEEVLLLQDRMQLAEGLEDSALAVKIELVVLGEQALEHELVRGAAAKTDVGVLVTDDLLRRPVVLRREPRVAERRQRIGGDGDFIVLANGDESGHRSMNSLLRAERDDREARRSGRIRPCRQRAGRASTGGSLDEAS